MTKFWRIKIQYLLNVKEVLSKQAKYVIIPINNPTNNVTFIFQRFYAKNLLKNCKTVAHVILIVLFLNLTQISLKITKLFLRKKLLWIFIVMIKYFHICTVFQNPKAKGLTSVLKSFFKQVRAYNGKYTFFSSVFTFRTVYKVNTKRKAHSVSTFGFSTLYTSINHKKLKFVLRK